MFKSAMLFAALFALLPLASARASAAVASRDCSAQQAAAVQAAKLPRPAADLSSCQELKGKRKKECEKPLRAKAREEGKAARQKVTALKHAFACCKKPDKEGCR
jgi:hypothetical protein